MKQLDLYISDTTAQPQMLRLAEIYAQALIESLDANMSPEDAAEELASLEKLVLSLPGGEQILTSPTVSMTRRMRIVKEIGQFVSPSVAGLLDVLAKNGRLAIIGLIAKACEKVVIHKAGKIEMTVRSAVKLDEAVKNRIAQQLGDALQATCIINNVVDPQIIGGLIMQKGDTVFDASIAGKLDRMAERFSTTK